MKYVPLPASSCFVHKYCIVFPLRTYSCMTPRPKDVRDEPTQRFLHFSLVMGSGQQQYKVISFDVIFFPWTLPSIAAKCVYNFLIYLWLCFSSPWSRNRTPISNAHQPSFPEGTCHPSPCAWRCLNPRYF